MQTSSPIDRNVTNLENKAESPSIQSHDHYDSVVSWAFPQCLGLDIQAFLLYKECLEPKIYIFICLLKMHEVVSEKFRFITNWQQLESSKQAAATDVVSKV